MAKYFQIEPGKPLPVIASLAPFKAVVLIEEPVDSSWQNTVSKWLVNEGCLYMMAWGIDCSSWDDSVDMANLEEYDYEEIPESKFVITTWHSNASIEDVFNFSKYSAHHSAIELEHALIIHISKQPKGPELTKQYQIA